MAQGKDSHSMGLRLDKITYNEVQELSEIKGMKKSQVIKMAIHRMYGSEKTDSADRMIVIAKSTFRKIFATLDSEEVEALALHNAQNNIIKIRQRVMQDIEDPSFKVQFDVFIHKFSTVLSKKHWQWVEDITTQSLDNREVVMFITHAINAQFSHFIKIVLKTILSTLFNTEIIEEKSIMAENQVELHFLQPEEN